MKAFSPRLYFIIFCLSNFLVAFAPLSPLEQFVIGVAGLLVPFLMGLMSSLKPPVSSAFFTNDDKKNVPVLWWIFFLAAFLFSRFYHLETFPLWPIFDEGVESIIGLHLYQNWSWQLIWGPVPHEPLLNWLLALFLNLSSPSLFSLRLYSVLLSTATAAAAYWAARGYFSKRFSFLFLSLFSFSYWVLTLSRLCIIPVLIPLWMFLAAGFLGRFIQSKDGHDKTFAGAGLILVTILGFYSWTNWLGVAAAILLVLFLYSWEDEQVSKKYFFLFIALTGLALCPLALARLSSTGMSHISHVFSWNILQAFQENAVGLFWHGGTSFPFGSIWGGFLNPIFTSLFLVGFLFYLKTTPSFRLAWTLGGAALCGLPVLFSSGTELYRNLPMMVLMTLWAAMGIDVLTQEKVGSSLKWPMLFIFLAASIGLDLYNYIYRYADIHANPPQQQFRSTTYAHAYQVLNDLQKTDGPIYVFSEFNTDYEDRTLNIACFPFDANQNPKLSTFHPRWAAVLANMNYSPYFQHHFKNCRFIRLKYPDDPSDKPERIVLFLVPTTDIPEEILDNWKKADYIHRLINFEIQEHDPNAYWNALAERLSSMAPSSWNDPLLTAVYWEKMGFFRFMGRNFEEAAKDYKNAATLGLPAHQLYYNWALSLQILGRHSEAVKALSKTH